MISDKSDGMGPVNSFYQIGCCWIRLNEAPEKGDDNYAFAEGTYAG
jgi:hypothetical protein